MKGFYVPGSRSGSYVASKRDESGSFQYDTAVNVLGAQKQAALQNLEQQYSSAIENAYASYLSTQRGINTSAMGQGYKEAYQQANQESLISNVNQAALSVAQTRQQLSEEYSAAEEQVHTQYEQEVSNIDKAVNSMSEYLNYVNSLQNASGQSYFTDAQKALDIEDLYEDLYTMQPRDYYSTDAETGVKSQGQSYYEWLYNQNVKDADYQNWLAYGGGWTDFLNLMDKSKKDFSTKQSEGKSYNTLIAKNANNENYSYLSDNKYKGEVQNLLASNKYATEEEALKATDELKSTIDKVEDIKSEVDNMKEYSKKTKLAYADVAQVERLILKELKRDDFSSYSDYAKALEYSANHIKEYVDKYRQKHWWEADQFYEWVKENYNK